MNSLNDRSEYKHGVQLLKNRIVEFENHNKIKSRFDLNLFDRFLFSDSLYSLSFTKNPDDLAFWNSYYVDKTTAVSIGFLRNRVFDANFKINKCIYGDPYPPMGKERYSWFKEIFKIENILQLSKNLEFMQITFQTAHIKNIAFEIEQEFRAVSFNSPSGNSGKFERNGKKVEYFDQKFNIDSICEIIIGPSSIQEINYLQTRALITDSKLRCVVKKSIIPVEF